MVKHQHLEQRKAVHEGAGQCKHWKTITSLKEIQFIQEFDSSSVLLLIIIKNIKTLKALCKSNHY